MSSGHTWLHGHRRVGLLAALLLPLIVLVFAACGDDDDDGGTTPTDLWRAPADMEGNWEVTVEMREHTTHELVSSETVTAPICTGDAAVMDPGQGYDCDIEPTADGFRMVCQETQSAGVPDCNAVARLDVTFECGADALCGTGTSTLSYAGSGCGALGSVSVQLDVSITGHKVGPAPAGACDGKCLGASVRELMGDAPRRIGVDGPGEGR